MLFPAPFSPTMATMGKRKSTRKFSHPLMPIKFNIFKAFLPPLAVEPPVLQSPHLRAKPSLRLNVERADGILRRERDFKLRLS